MWRMRKAILSGSFSILPKRRPRDNEAQLLEEQIYFIMYSGLLPQQSTRWTINKHLPQQCKGRWKCSRAKQWTLSGYCSAQFLEQRLNNNFWCSSLWHRCSLLFWYQSKESNVTPWTSEAEEIRNPVSNLTMLLYSLDFHNRWNDGWWSHICFTEHSSTTVKKWKGSYSNVYGYIRSCLSISSARSVSMHIWSPQQRVTSQTCPICEDGNVLALY